MGAQTRLFWNSSTSALAWDYTHTCWTLSQEVLPSSGDTIEHFHEKVFSFPWIDCRLSHCVDIWVILSITSVSLNYWVYLWNHINRFRLIPGCSLMLTSVLFDCVYYMCVWLCVYSVYVCVYHMVCVAPMCTHEGPKEDNGGPALSLCVPLRQGLWVNLGWQLSSLRSLLTLPHAYSPDLRLQEWIDLTVPFMWVLRGLTQVLPSFSFSCFRQVFWLIYFNFSEHNTLFLAILCK